MLHLHDGYFFVDKVFVQGGAYVSVLRDLEQKLPAKIVCRGTALRPTATDGFRSGLNDALVQIGTLGITSIWPSLSKYLKDNKITDVEILGKSLGGAHAQELAVLVEGVHKINVKKLTTYCSVGVGKEINNLFQKEIANTRNTPFNIHVIRNGGNAADEADAIPAVGGVHLGEGLPKEKCQIEIDYIHSGRGKVNTLATTGSFFALPKNFIASFNTGHCRQSTLDEFSWNTIDDHIEKNEHLRIGEQLETIRKYAAHALNYATFLQINTSFDKFFYDQKKSELLDANDDWIEIEGETSNSATTNE